MTDSMVEAMIEEGQTAIDALPSHASRISNLLGTHFPAQTLEAVHTAMRPTVEAAKGGVNTKVAELSSLVREEAAVAAAQFRAIEMWLRLKQPAISDGNNFGVEIQTYVLEQLQKMRTDIEAMIIAGRDYYWTRGQGLEKLFSEDKSVTTTTEDKSTDAEDGKPKEKSSKGVKTTNTSEKKVAYPDYTEYVVCVDVRQYHLMFNHLTDLRNNYLKTHVLFAKNMKKLNDPRGDGDGKTANVMSMF